MLLLDDESLQEMLDEVSNMNSYEFIEVVQLMQDKTYKEDKEEQK
jgi:hypothetical protein